MSSLLHEISEGSEIWISDLEGQTTRGGSRLIAVAATAQDPAEVFRFFYDHVEEQSVGGEITALFAEIYSNSAILRKLDDVIGEFPYHRRYSWISQDLTTVKDSLKCTFRDARRLLEGLKRTAGTSRAEYGYEWGDLRGFFRAQCGNTLRRRLEIYRLVSQEFLNMLIEG